MNTIWFYFMVSFAVNQSKKIKMPKTNCDVLGIFKHKSDSR